MNEANVTAEDGAREWQKLADLINDSGALEAQEKALAFEMRHLQILLRRTLKREPSKEEVAFAAMKWTLPLQTRLLVGYLGFASIVDRYLGG